MAASTPEVIYPTNVRKYRGYIRETVCKTFTVSIVSNGLKIYKNFKDYDSAFMFLKQQNIEHSLPIKNIIYKHENSYSVRIGNSDMLFDLDDLQLVQAHILCCCNGYCTTYINKKQTYFHNLVMKHTPGSLTIDHIDRNRLNNQKSNLRIVNASVQLINQNRKSNNSSGMVGVGLEEGRKWTARVQNTGSTFRKSFSIKKYGFEEAKQMAIDWRNEKIKSIPNYIEALQLTS